MLRRNLYDIPNSDYDVGLSVSVEGRPATVTGVTYWMDNSIDVTFVYDDDVAIESKTVQVMYPHGDLC